MEHRRIAITAAAALVVAAGVAYAASVLRARDSAPRPAVRDPALALVLALGVLERDPRTQLSREQVATVLPLLKALKDIPPSDAAAVDAIVRTVSETLTPDQRAAIAAARRRLEERQSRGEAAAGGGRGAAAPTGPRQSLRAQAFERVIRVLERAGE
jgi:hypothetical protein